MLYAFRYAPDFGIDGDRLVDVVFIGVVMGVICARAYYVIFAPFDYTSFWQMIDIRQGGLAIYGGVIGAFVFGGLAAKWRKVPILPLFDLVGICFLIGQGVAAGPTSSTRRPSAPTPRCPGACTGEGTREYLGQCAVGACRRGRHRGPRPAGAPHLPVRKPVVLCGLCAAGPADEAPPFPRAECFWAM